MEDSRKYFLAQLNFKKVELEERLRKLMRDQREYHDQASADWSADEFDHAQREISFASLYGLIEKKTKELKKIINLIEKTSEDENFGICEECGEVIPFERLLVVPEAAFCVECQRQLEKLDQARSLMVKPLSSFRGKNEMTWENYEGIDDFSCEIIEADLDLVPILDIDELTPPEAVEGKQEKLDAQ